MDVQEISAMQLPFRLIVCLGSHKTQNLTLTYTNIQRGHVAWEPEHGHKQNKSAKN